MPFEVNLLDLEKLF